MIRGEMFTRIKLDTNAFQNRLKKKKKTANAKLLLVVQLDTVI